ncbi:MAG: flagellar export chaperone FlgN [Deltaproteobacteria bacterium]|nr:flagellar export chaperone FlgN [Deltaproteobacteria bacterium]
MLDERVADRWLAVFDREESLVSRLIEILQSDQRAVAYARVEELEENIRLKEALLADVQVVEESKKRLGAAAGILLSKEEPFAATVLPHFPPAHRARAKESLERIRSLREALSELNDATRQLMVHGLWLVRSTLGAVYGAAGAKGYGENGDYRPAYPTGRIVRKDV